MDTIELHKYKGVAYAVLQTEGPSDHWPISVDVKDAPLFEFLYTAIDDFKIKAAWVKSVHKNRKEDISYLVGRYSWLFKK